MFRSEDPWGVKVISIPKTMPRSPESTNKGRLKLYTVDEKDGEEIREPISQGAYRVVGDEVLQENLDPECWAKALAAGAKTRDEALGVYAKIRAENLAEQVSEKEYKAKALEVRRLSAGISEAPQTRIVWKRSFSLMWDFLFWQILLSVSGVGLFLVLLAVGPGSSWWPGLLPVVVVSACLQLFPIGSYLMGKLLVGRVRYSQALGFSAICLIGLGSLMSVQAIMGKKPPHWLTSVIERAAKPEASVSFETLSDEEF